MRLYILRHAWAYERDFNRWPEDGDRPLTEEGKHRFQRVADALAQRGCQPELIATSPLIRCQQTARLLAAALEQAVPVVELPCLAPGSDLRELLAWSNRQRAGSLAWVGHVPDVNNFVGALLGAEDANIRFAKGAVAALRFEQEIRLGQGELQWLLTARMLGY